MAQHLLEGAHVHAVLEHEGGRRVPQLVAGVEGGIQPRLFQPLLDHIVDAGGGHPGVGAAEEQGVGIGGGLVAALLQPVVQGGPAGIVEEDHPLFVTLAQHPELLLPDVL